MPCTPKPMGIVAARSRCRDMPIDYDGGAGQLQIGSFGYFEVQAKAVAG